MATETKNTKAFYNTEIPGDWSSPEFGDVFNFLKTFSFSREQLTNEPTNDEIRNIHYGDIHATYENEILDLEIEKTVPYLLDGIIDPNSFDDENFPALKEGDLIIADASEDYEGVCDCVELKNINGAKIVSGLHTFAARATENKIALGYRTYALQHEQVIRELRRIATGTSVYGVSKNNLSKVRIPLPPLSEQKAIAQVLSTADAAIHTTEKLIAQKELRKKWLMQQLLTGKKRLKGFDGERKEVKLSECLSRMANGITYDTEKRTGIPVTRIETISDGVINFNKIGFADSVDNIEDYRLQKGDILYSHINSLSHIGKVAIYDNEEPLYHGMNLLLLRCNEKVNSNFFYQWLVSENGRKKAVSLAKPAVNQASISTTELRKVPISIPTYEEQTAIAQVLQAADKEISLLKAKAEKLREQKKGLMQVLLTGKVRLKINDI